ncbi:MAG: hypothetical protein L0215_20675 [Gemmataceae bacterium]|nr:hypothetical protein [Gemmataceae bacterium]
MAESKGKPNLSRLENDKVTPKFETLRAVAAALGTHTAMLIQKDAWEWTRHIFTEWKLNLLWKGAGSRLVAMRARDLVNLFLATRPEHSYARAKLLKHANHAPPEDPQLAEYSLDADKLAREMAVAKAAREFGHRPLY